MALLCWNLLIPAKSPCPQIVRLSLARAAATVVHTRNRLPRISKTCSRSFSLCCPRATLSGNSSNEHFESDEPTGDDNIFPSGQEDSTASEVNSNSVQKSSGDSREESLYEAFDSASRNSSPDSWSSSSSPPSQSAPSLQIGGQLTQDEMRQCMTTLSRSLEVLSTTLNEVSSAVRVLSAALSSQPSTSDTLPFISGSHLQERPNKAGSREEPGILQEPPEPWDIPPALAIATGNRGKEDRESNPVPQHLVEQNRRAHKLAYRLQQAFIQARIEGLGKPFQVAVEEFADTCMEAHSYGFGLKELQLQLVLQDGALTGAFAIRNQRFSNDSIMNEESRVRSLWVRLVYSTLAQFEERQKPPQIEESTKEENHNEQMDNTDAFVKEILQMALEEGYDLARLKLEQVPQAINSHTLYKLLIRRTPEIWLPCPKVLWEPSLPERDAKSSEGLECMLSLHPVRDFERTLQGR